jgi:hypothetical protein
MGVECGGASGAVSRSAAAARALGLEYNKLKRISDAGPVAAAPGGTGELSAVNGPAPGAHSSQRCRWITDDHLNPSVLLASECRSIGCHRITLALARCGNSGRLNALAN